MARHCQMDHVVPDVVEFVCFLSHCSCLSGYLSVSEQDILHGMTCFNLRPYHNFPHQHLTHHLNLSRIRCCQRK